MTRFLAMFAALAPFVVGCAGVPSAPGGRADDRARAPAAPAGAPRDRIAIRVDTGEADAVLALIDGGGRAGADDAWRRLFDSQGYRRLKAREAAMQRPFGDGEFRAFVLSPDLAARAPELRASLARWSAADLHASAARVLRYLPAEARIEATVFPVIKPKENSFVYLGEGLEPSIFLYIDPAVSEAKFENTVAHELHHIGFASLPEEPCASRPAVCAARTWTGGFGEGFAMLAAAGGPDVHPHRDSTPEDRARWDRDVTRFDEDLARVQDFLRKVVGGELDEAGAQRAGMEFFGVQGPWYTVGWTMAVAVERCFGRAALVGAMRRPWTVLARFNEAVERCPPAGPPPATWSRDLLAELD